MNERLRWFAAVSFVAIFGFGELANWLLTETWWGLDLHLVLDAGSRWAGGGDLYADPKFLYPPLAAVLGAPLARLPFDPVSVVYAGLKVAVAVAAVLAVTPGWSRFPRGLAVVGVVGSLPFVHDLMLGNANVVLVAATVPAVLLAPRPAAGIALGLAVAVFAKPLTVPVLLWLLVWRRPVFVGAVAAAGAATLAGIALAGPGAYVSWVGALFAGTRHAAPFEGNHGVSALAPDLWVPIAIVTAVGLVWVLLRRGPDAGLAWAVASGILIAPYAGTYSALPIVLALPVLYRAFPRFVLGLVALSPFLTTHPLPFLAGAVLVGGLALHEERIPRALPCRQAPVSGTAAT